MKHEITSWNTFTWVSQCHCVCFSSRKNCVYREKISSDRENLIALIFINNICNICYSKQRQKKSKRSRRILMKPWLKNRSDKKTCASIFSELLFTNKFQHYLRMNPTSCYWSYTDFYTLITFLPWLLTTFYITCTHNYTVCIDYFDIIFTTL